MNNENIIIKKILATFRDVDKYINITEPDFRDSKYLNELLFFIKPELLQIQEDKYINETLKLIFNRFLEYGIHIKGLMIVGGNTLREKEIMNNHYGFIDRLSRFGSKNITNSDIFIIREKLNIDREKDLIILGGHEFLDRFKDETENSLANLWFSKKSIKIRSGFYFQNFSYKNQNLIILNGFHPQKLLHYTDKNSRLILFLIESNSDWKCLRNEMVGDTFPEKADHNSIRGALFSNPKSFGLDKVDISNNGIHLSAGPYEGMFEISNFYGKILDIDITKYKPLLLKKMVEKGIKLEEALTTLTNPTIYFGGKNINLFSITEDVNSPEAIEIWREYEFNKRK